MVTQFNGYVNQHQTHIPFQNNNLINQNVHVRNNLNDLMSHHKMVQNQMQQMQQMQPPIQVLTQNQTFAQPSFSNDISTSKKKPLPNIRKGKNIIEEMLKPVKIIKENKDIESKYKKREEKQKEIISKKDMTNAPYKVIIKDKIMNKNVEDVVEKDFIVHCVIKEIDADLHKFEKELGQKETNLKEIDEYLVIEYAPEHYCSHKTNFDIKKSFIKNMAYEQNTFDENKNDYIEFYRKKQKEAEEGLELCDQALRNLVDNGIISKDELPCNESQIKSDLSSNSTDTEEFVTTEPIATKTTEPIATKTTEPIIKPTKNIIDTKKASTISNAHRAPTNTPKVTRSIQSSLESPNNIIPKHSNETNTNSEQKTSSNKTSISTHRVNNTSKTASGTTRTNNTQKLISTTRSNPREVLTKAKMNAISNTKLPHIKTSKKVIEI